MGWLITLGILLLLAVLPLGVRVRYAGEGLLVRLILGPVKFTVIPLPKKKPKANKRIQQKQPGQSAQPTETKAAEKPLPQPPQPPPEKKEKKESGGSLLDFLPLVKTALDLLGDFRRKLRIDDLYLRLILGSSDPCDLAVNYGKVWAAVGNLMPQLDRLFVIKKRDVEVECDFTASETTVIARVDVTITLGRLLALVTVYGFRAVKEFLTIQKKRKGGAAV
ncbi:MAG: DUF2953 domain-containing protein [Oscillospiraceae bacterium]|nr:DUF2953 domain-containing protein [Oscillospiraceae bacterium]